MPFHPASRREAQRIEEALSLHAMFNQHLWAKDPSSSPNPDSTQRTRRWLDHQLQREAIVSPSSSESSHDLETPSSNSSSENQQNREGSNVHPEAPRKPQTFTKAFQFVSETDPDPRKTVRKHVMKEFQRERRFLRVGADPPESSPKRRRSRPQKRATSRDDKDSEAPAVASKELTPSPNRSPETARGSISTSLPSRPSPLSSSSPSTTNAASAPARPGLPRAQSAADRSSVEQPTVPAQRQVSEPYEAPSPSLRTPLGASYVDPFETLPVEGNFSTNRLVDHYVRSLSPMVFRMATRPDFNPIKDTFKLALQEPVSFHAILLYAASHLACVHNIRDCPQVALHKGKALQLLARKLNPGQFNNSDGAIMAVQQLTSVEERWGRPEVAKTHWKGLRQLVESRGGLEVIRRSAPRLEILIDFTDLATTANQPTDLTPQATSLLTSLPSPRLDTPSDGFYHTSFLFDALDLPTYRSQFRQFISNVIALTHECLSYAQASQPHPLNIPRRVLMLRTGTTLHDVLFQPLRERRGIPFTSAQMYCQMGVLVYLSATFVDFRNDPSLIDYFLKAQELNIVEWDLELLPSIETLLFILQRGERGTTLDQPERMWWTGRMVGMLKRGSQEDWNHIRDVLLSFVTVNCG